QTLQFQTNNPFPLLFPKIKSLHQLVLSIPLILSSPNRSNHFINHPDTFHHPFNDILPLNSFF
ncbi:hypothetical protein, partial [Siminovitchia fortis]|uniref:hypothetical protein n=1 Tax=Siminovitchia fortis TaxID=254758 RepID=UPI001C92FC98